VHAALQVSRVEILCLYPRAQRHALILRAQRWRDPDGSRATAQSSRAPGSISVDFMNPPTGFRMFSWPIMEPTTGLSNDDIANNIQQWFDDQSDYRAMLIARTETINAYGVGALEGYSSQG
jgi:hypothetical protein